MKFDDEIDAMEPVPSIYDGNRKVSSEMEKEAYDKDYSGEKAGLRDLAIRYNRLYNGSNET